MSAAAPPAPMPRPATDSALAVPVAPLIGGAAGIAAAAILTVNLLKIAGVVPTVPLAQLIAPGGQALAILFVVGLAARALPASTGAFVVTALNLLGLAFGVGVEYVLNLALRQVPPAVREDLLAGALTPALLGTSVFFLLASLAFCAVLWQYGAAPRPALVGYALGAMGIGLRPLIPEPLFLTGLGAMILAVLVLSLWMLRDRDAEPTSVRGA